ncbi:MAG: D-ribose pyranase, partial [Vibrio sp.]
AELAAVLTSLGHTDEITVCDAGLPIANNVQKIDLALKPGLLSFEQVTDFYIQNVCIEGVLLAREIQNHNPEIHQMLLDKIKAEEQKCGKTISVTYVDHEAFKQRTQHSRAVIRSGECTPYSNIIFISGVNF